MFELRVVNVNVKRAFRVRSVEVSIEMMFKSLGRERLLQVGTRSMAVKKSCGLKSIFCSNGSESLT